MDQKAKTIQILSRMSVCFALAYGLAGFLHAFVAVAALAIGSHDMSQTGRDLWIFIAFIAAETIEAPVTGGFLRMPGNDGALSYVNLYPLIAPVFVIFYFASSLVWKRQQRHPAKP